MKSNIEIALGRPRDTRSLDDADNTVSTGSVYGEQSLNNEPLDDLGSLYLEHRSLLLGVATRKFHVPESEAETLIQDVFLSLLQSPTEVRDVRSWLVAAMCNASRHYWRSQGQTDSVPEDFATDRVASAVVTELLERREMTAVLSYLQPKCRDVLQLYYVDGKTVAEVAKALQTTDGYAEKLIQNCSKRAREIYLKIQTMMSNADPTSEQTDEPRPIS